MNARLAAWLAWSQFVLSILAGVTGLALFYQSGHVPSDPADTGLNPSTTAAILAFAGMGALIASRRPSNPVGWLLCLAGLLATLGMSGFGYGYVNDSLEGPIGLLPGTAWLAWFAVTSQNIVWFVVALVFVLFPAGKPASPRWRGVVWLTIGLATLNALLIATQPQSLLGFRAIPNPIVITLEAPLARAATVASGWSDAFAPLALVVGTLSVISRFRSAQGIERQQLKWVVYALTMAPVYFALLIGVTFLAFNLEPHAGPDASASSLSGLVDVGWAGWPIVLATLPLSIGIAILRYGLFDIDLIIRRTLVYGAVSAVLALAYWTSVAVLQQVLRPLTQGSELALVASTLAVATLFQPLRARIQQTVNRRFYRRSYDAARTLETFTARLRDEVDLDALTSDLVGTAVQTVQPVHASLWLRANGAQSRPTRQH